MIEQQIEQSFIDKLTGLKYEYRTDITDRAALEKNFREKFEALNRVRLTDSEFARLLDDIVTPDVFTAAKTLRGINAFTRDDGTPLNYTLVNLKDWCKNHFEVIHQLRINTDNSHHRYDVILLINGVPVVQIELKTLGVNPRRAMEQIVEYKRDPGNGYTKTLLCFMQLFIVSNRDRTYYFANNNARHFAFHAEERFLPVYEFADEANKKITQLDAFAERFLKKCDLGRTISRYMVLLAGEQKLMIMRPYQVYAVQHMVKCIDDDNGNGYIWHTTGSGKTLTSFKASTLLKENDHIHKCVFVVDRKDLDRQTREEFNRFQEGCVEENTNTAALVRRLLSEDYADKVIVTTIQKLGLALDENSKRNKQRSKNGQATYKEQLEALKDKRIVFIFDECHRSQFGENHKAIKAFFPKAQLFGFTGTPIFEANASLQKIEETQASMKTTADLFQKQLHAYTITHAIEDGNVLRFHVDYFKVAGASSSQVVAGASSSQVKKTRELEAPTTWEYFNPSTEIDIHKGDLPHWEQGPVWYFVTFRLADSLPLAVVTELKEARERWKQNHDLDNLSPAELAEYHRLFSDRYETLLNAGSGSCALRDPTIAKIMDDALHHFEGQRYDLDEYVIMPNHVHVLVKPRPGHRLVDILHSWKSFTANQINKRLGKTGQFWQHESYDHIVRHERAMDAIRRYIRENPVVVGASSSFLIPSTASSSKARNTRELEAPTTVAGASCSQVRKPRELEAPTTKKAVIEAILAKHDAATGGRRFNALLATASINDAIEYHALFKTMQAEKAVADPDFKPLNIACVFSPPAQLAENPESKKDIEQLSEDLPQEQEDNKVEPEAKKKALEAILADYNARYGTNHRLGEFDLYYQDVQKRIKDQQWRGGGSFQLPSLSAGARSSSHIDITIVVDMLLTGFDSKFLNTLYVDKNLKHHGLIQAFSRTNRVLNGTKPYGNILDFRQQQDAVDAAIALFSGEKTGEQARKIWLVDKAPVVIQKLETAVRKLDDFMKSQSLACTPSAVANLKGDEARAAFITHFKEVQRLKTQLDQYTDLTGEDKAAIEQVLPEDNLRGFKGQYLETAKRLREQRGNGGDKPGSADPVDQLDFEFVLFASAVIDYDYIMGLITKFSEKGPGKSKMTREELIGLISADAKFMNERDDIAEYIGTLKAGEGLSETAIREGYTRFKAEKNAKELAAIAAKHGLATAALQSFVDGILDRMIFDGERLGDLMAPLDLGWKARTQAELALMEDLHPLLTKRAGGRDISGLRETLKYSAESTGPEW